MSSSGLSSNSSDRQQDKLQDRRGGTYDKTPDDNVPERLRRMKETDSLPDNKSEQQSHSTTNEPWKKPGQTSQDESQQPTPNVVEQEKGKKGIR